MHTQGMYAPTLYSSPEEIGQFYQDLDEELSKILKAEKPYLLRDFNAKVGADHDV